MTPVARPAKITVVSEGAQTSPSEETPDDEAIDLGEEDIIELDEGDAESAPASERKRRRFLQMRPFAQLAGVVEADTPVKHVMVLGEGITEIDPVNVTVDLVDIMLGPIREANLLLPRRFDPLAGDEEEKSDTLLPKLSRRESKEFKPSEQRRLLGTQLAARDDTPNSNARWHWQATAGGTFRQGNNSNANIHSQFQAQRRSDLSVLSAKTGVFYNRANDDSTNRRALGEVIIDRNLRGRWIWYGREEAEYDQARLINLRNIASTGLGFKFIDRLNQRLVARTGPTISHVIYNSDDEDNETRSGWLLESEYRHLIGESVRVEWTTSAFPQFDNDQQFRIRSDAALLFPIGVSSAWSWKVGLRHDYQLNPIATTRETDLEGYFSITYSK